MVALIKLAEIYIRMRRLDEAQKVADRTQQLFPDEDGTLLTRAKVDAQLKAHDAAERLLRMVIGRDHSHPQARAAAGYERGALLDRQARQYKLQYAH